MPADRPIRSGVAERQGDETRALVRLHPKQQRVFAVLTRVSDLVAHLARIGDRLAADIEDHVADAEAVIGSNAVRVDRSDKHAFAVGSWGFAAGSQREP